MTYHGKDEWRIVIVKHKNSKIGEYGIRWEPVEGYETKDGIIIPPHYRKVEFEWTHNS